MTENLYVAAGSTQRFITYCAEHELDPHSPRVRYVAHPEHMMGVRDGRLVILPDYTDGWQEMVARARFHDMEVQVL